VINGYFFDERRAAQRLYRLFYGPSFKVSWLEMTTGV